MRMNFGTLVGFLALIMFFMDPGSAHATRRVPEPATLTLLASGAAVLGAIGLLRRRKK